jgi:pimeloyl-ACP methyl ester carboxylesterase
MLRRQWLAGAGLAGLCRCVGPGVWLSLDRLPAANALQAKLSQAEDQFRERLGVLGHSIGCAAGLMAADDLEVKKVVLISPFTSMTEMGRRLLGWPLCYLNLHTFDNRKFLARVCAKGARVSLFHGTADQAIPITMSRELAAAHPQAAHLREIEGAGHNDVVGRAAAEIGAAMAAAD